MAKKIFEMTPFGTVVWSALTKPVENDKGEMEYGCKIEVSSDDLAAWRAKMKKHAENFTFKSTSPKLGISVRGEDGKITLLGKSKFKPALFDAKNNKIDEARIGQGSVVRMNVALNGYDKGISLMLSQVQVKKLVEYSSGTPGESAFGETDGHVAENTGFGAGVEDTPATTEKDVDALGI